MNKQLSVYGVWVDNTLRYIGQTVDFKNRVWGHEMKKKHPNKKVEFLQILTSLTQEEADFFERDLIAKNDLIQSGDNVSSGGKRNHTWIMKESGRRKISVGLKGKPKSPRHIANMPTKFKKGHKTWNKGNHGYMRGNSASFKATPIIVKKDGKIIGEYYSQTICSHELNLNQAKISLCLLGKKPQYKGYTFERAQGESHLTPS